MTLEATKQQLDDHIEHHKEIDKIIIEKLDGIIKRQDVANGRLNKGDLWKARLTGAWIVLSFMFSVILIPLAFYYLKSSNQVETQVNKALSEYLEKQ